MSDAISSSPLSHRITQSAAILVSSFWAGTNVSITLFTVPTLLSLPPSLALTSWASLFRYGKKISPPIGLAGALSYATAAYLTTTKSPVGYVNRNRDFWGYVGAAGLSLGLVPFTFAFMGKTNAELMGRAERVKKGETDGKREQDEVRKLIRRWGRLNASRAGLLVASSVVGVWVTLF